MGYCSTGEMVGRYFSSGLDLKERFICFLIICFLIMTNNSDLIDNGNENKYEAYGM